MKRLLLAMWALVCATTLGVGTALAGGSSSTSSGPYHCYMFFALPGEESAQVMVNAEDPEEALTKALEYAEKYHDEGGVLFDVAGNLREGHDVDTVGDRLSPICDTCIWRVCTLNESFWDCCTNEWHDVCVQAADFVCSWPNEQVFMLTDLCTDPDATDATCGYAREMAQSALAR